MEARRERERLAEIRKSDPARQAHLASLKVKIAELKIRDAKAAREKELRDEREHREQLESSNRELATINACQNT